MKLHAFLAACDRTRTDERGQGLVEYALILLLVSVTAITVLGFVSDGVNCALSDVANALGVGGGC